MWRKKENFRKRIVKHQNHLFVFLHCRSNKTLSIDRTSERIATQMRQYNWNKRNVKQNWVIDRSTDTLKRDLSNFQSQITNKQTLFTSAQFQNPDFHCKLLNKCHSVFVTDLDVLYCFCVCLYLCGMSVVLDVRVVCCLLVLLM